VAEEKGRTARGMKIHASGLQRSRLPRTFLDSNVLIYADDAAYPVKQGKAVALIMEHGRQRSAVVSLQVLGEYYSAATRKLHLDPGVARSQVELYAQFQVVEPTLTDILGAIDLHRLHGISYYDSLILRCAKQSGCSVLLTEDMQHGQVIDGVRIVNPFL
jgi:predicted nucleic acid-binding protein